MKLVLTFMLMAFSFAFMVETSDISNQRGKTNHSILMDIIQRVLNDPEFLALGNKQQLHVLIAIYNIIEGHYNKQGFNGRIKV